LGSRGRWISEFEASMVYKVSSRTARAIPRNPVSKKKKSEVRGAEATLATGVADQIYYLNIQIHL
jgi:hypothetical protein